MPDLLLISPVRPTLLAALQTAYSVHLFYDEADPQAWLAAHAGSIEAVVTGGHTGITPALMAALPALRIIAINGVGYDRVDLEAARARGIRVTNTPDVLTDDVADLAVGLTIALLRQLPYAHAHVAAGRWPTAEWPLTRKVTGKRFGVMGMGRIGQAVARRLAAFDGKIGYTANSDKPGPYTRYPDVQALAAASDVLIVCAARLARHPPDRRACGVRRARPQRRPGQHRARLHRGRAGAGAGAAGGPAGRRRARRVRG